MNAAQTFNLTDAEAVVVNQRVDAGADVDTAALAVRAERVGPAGDPAWRPLPPDTATRLGVTAEGSTPDDGFEILDGPVEPPDDEQVEEDLLAWADQAVADGQYATVDDALTALHDLGEVQP